MDLIFFLGQWTRSHLSEIAFSITAMILVVVGPYINAGAKRLSQKFHWLFRYVLFVVLTTVGYGLLANFALRNMRGVLYSLSTGTMLLAVLLAHLVLAWMLKADKKI